MLVLAEVTLIIVVVLRLVIRSCRFYIALSKVTNVNTLFCLISTYGWVNKFLSILFKSFSLFCFLSASISCLLIQKST